MRNGAGASAFAWRAVVVAPGGEHAYDEAEWRDAIVLVARGELELDCDDGSRPCFHRGAILWLVGLPVRTLQNRGTEPTVLVAVSRR
jgi:quercetin dioxygenase-like cupin family protein